ncbi:MAG: RING finger protein [Amphiamblys sp. WSBS2006]|nr:MAG: RING finger protein [Amphiamblys sp. WSBS2006]
MYWFLCHGCMRRTSASKMLAHCIHCGSDFVENISDVESLYQSGAEMVEHLTGNSEIAPSEQDLATRRVVETIIRSGIDIVRDTFVNPVAEYEQQIVDNVTTDMMDNTEIEHCPLSEEARETLRYMKAVRETECPICFETIQAGTPQITLTCEHTYHPDCILEWFVKMDTCPLCRIKQK